MERGFRYHANVISALKGLAIHLPLALHETYSYVQTTLPSSDNLSIFVHSSSGWIVVVLAPTGIAAYNINGQTLHRFFKLPISHGKIERH